MGNIEDRRGELRRKSIEELRSRSVGRLLRIIEELEAMDLSVRDIENVLKACGLNEDCAKRFAAYITDEKEKNKGDWDSLTHP
jgi:hypothetical protein